MKRYSYTIRFTNDFRDKHIEPLKGNSKTKKEALDIMSILDETVKYAWIKDNITDKTIWDKDWV